MIRVSFSNAVKRAIEHRAAGHCEQCGAACLKRSDYEIDHVVAEAHRTGERSALTAEDGKLLCLPCHDRKTRKDLADIAKGKRLQSKHRALIDAPTQIARRFGVPQEPNR